MILTAKGRMFTFHLEHQLVCASTGKCTCEHREVERRTRLKDGRMEVRFVPTNIPRSVILVPGSTAEVPDAAMRIGRVERALRNGRIARA